MSGQASHIANIRQDYQQASLDEHTAGLDPLAFFSQWFREAVDCEITEVNAMTLCTVDTVHRPHARIVLLKGLEENAFVFFTNYDSAKGKEIEANPHVALTFFWKELERQVRIEGLIEKVSAASSDEYFHSRPAGSRIGAWASPQSAEIGNRQILEDNYQRYEQEFPSNNIPRPQHWGGYRVVPEKIEFWQGRSSRMHDRILFTWQGNGSWRRSRLAP